MIFTELQFFVFFAVVFSISWKLNNRNRKVFLLLASYVFYGAWDWRFLSLIVGSTIVDYFVGLSMSRTAAIRRRRGLLLLSLCVNLGVLGVFKYCNFFLESAVELANAMGWPLSHSAINIVLPVGISFYTFQTLSYTIDIYRNKLKAEKSFLDFSFFVAFFPQLVAGPIVRASDFLPQLKWKPAFSSVKLRVTLALFLVGFFKKACVADNIAVYVDQYFVSPESYDSVSAWLATILYAIQVYCDFSGYSEMAIATAALLGYRLRDNFNFPYLASNIASFWHCWHMSLSTWLRDYLTMIASKSRSQQEFLKKVGVPACLLSLLLQTHLGSVLLE